MNIVFEGGGFPAFWYGLGYGMELLEHERPAFLAGYSAGALVATLLTCSNVDIDTVVQLYGRDRKSRNPHCLATKHCHMSYIN